ncbi:SubName: Full=Uncharacterized protein {ECO:0000313/EMBL:KDQ53029.1} [Serendipita indica DSM 11827]|nr:SubName: Full=Uncharacterized protein {ECO:0000313/EMBL:KDQ53029.1} [Serendipita indica DSM 11827]
METAVSDSERLSAFYVNAAYDCYGTLSNALCVYKNGDAWPVRVGPEAQRIIREARGVHGHPMQPSWRELGQRIFALLDQYKRSGSQNQEPPRERIVALGSFAYTAALKDMMDTVDKLERSIKQWEIVLRKIGDPKEGEPKATTLKRNELAAYKFYTETVQRWTIPDERIIGEVVHVDPIAVNVTPIPDRRIIREVAQDDPISVNEPSPRFTRDWALIELRVKA